MGIDAFKAVGDQNVGGMVALFADATKLFKGDVAFQQYTTSKLISVVDLLLEGWVVNGNVQNHAQTVEHAQVLRREAAAGKIVPGDVVDGAIGS